MQILLSSVVLMARIDLLPKHAPNSEKVTIQPCMSRAKQTFSTLHDMITLECVYCHAIKNKIKNHSVDKVKKL